MSPFVIVLTDSFLVRRNNPVVVELVEWLKETHFHQQVQQTNLGLCHAKVYQDCKELAGPSFGIQSLATQRRRFTCPHSVILPSKMHVVSVRDPARSKVSVESVVHCMNSESTPSLSCSLSAW